MSHPPPPTPPRQRAWSSFLYIAFAGTALVANLLWARPAMAFEFNHHRNDPRERVLRSPVTPSNSSSNWVRRAYTVASGTTGITFEYDFLCSGGAFTKCVVEYSTSSSGPWTILRQMIGQVYLSGHGVHTLPTTSPTLYVRFRYDKGTLTGYQDGFAVDDVRFTSNKMRVHEDFAADVPFTGWTAGGTNGGFTKQKPPPARALGPTEGLPASTTITIERTVTGFGNTNNSCTITYATDTAPTHYFKVWEGTIVRFEKSGQSFGTVSIPLTNSAGSKTLKLEATRDASAIQGTNLVRVKGITCYTGGTIVLGHWDFDGQALDSSPYWGWTQSCVGTGCSPTVGWRVVRPTPHQSYVPPQAFGTTPFTLDGLPYEYKNQGNATPVTQFDDAQPTVRHRPLLLFSTETQLHIYWRLNAATPTVIGNESGSIYLFVDNKRGLTLKRQSECGAGQYQHPAASDRVLAFSYNLGAAEAQAITPSSVSQQKGACNGSWAALGGSDPLANLNAYVRDPGEDTFAIEMVLDLFSDMTTEGLLGLGLQRYTGNPATTRREFLPFQEYGAAPPITSDAHSWETIRLTSVVNQVLAPTEREDMCCFAPKNL